MFQALARDRLERLNASPSATPWTYFRVYSALLLVLAVDFLWLWCYMDFTTTLQGRLPIAKSQIFSIRLQRQLKWETIMRAKIK